MEKPNTAMACLLLASAVIATSASIFLAEAQNATPNPTLTPMTASINPTNVAQQTYIVTLRREADQARCANDHKLKRKMQFHYALNGFVADLDDAAVQRLKQDNRVLAVEPDQKTRLDCQSIPTGISRMGIDQFPLAKIDGIDERINVDVAVVDSGIQTNHPDLNVNNGYEEQDNVVAGAAGESPNSWDADDNNGHGTIVAGIIGALDNDIGVVGAAPGARLWAIKVFTANGTGSLSWGIDGLDFVAQHADQISVVNMSLNGIGVSSGFETAIQGLVNQGVVVVVSAGNNAGDVAGADGIFGTSDDIIPASYPEVMAVSAMNPTNDTIANFSNYSRATRAINYVFSTGGAIDVTAPGVNIVSTYTNSLYAIASGTSMSAPYVTGLVALYIAANGRATNAAGVYKIRQTIVNSSLPQSQWNTTNTLDPDNNPEPLAIASTNWIPSPNITIANQSNESMQLNFDAVPNYSYVAQYKDLLSEGQWTNLSDLVIGCDSVAPTILSDTTPNHSSRFYRLAMSPTPIALSITNASSDKTIENAYAADVLTNQSGVVGNSFRFSNPNLFTNETGCFVTVPFSPDLNLTGPFTVEFWAKPAQPVNDSFCLASAFCNLISKHSNSSVTNIYIYLYGWTFYLTPSNQWQFSVGRGGITMTSIFGGTAQTNVWQHVAGVYDGANISLYINGALVAGPTPVSNFSPNFSQPLRFGATSDGTRTFDGWLDEPAIYTNALSAAQISAHYSAATTNNPGYGGQILGDGPVGYWHFD